MRCLLLLWGFILVADPLAPDYRAKLQNISQSPEQVKSALLANPPPEDATSIIKAQHQFVLAQVYLNLVYPLDAITAAQQGLDELNSMEHDWMKHRLNLALAMAYDLNAQSDKGIRLAQLAHQWGLAQNDEELVIDSLIAQGYIANTKGLSIDALNYFLKAYELAPDEAAPITKGAIASSIALVYEYRRENQLAIPYFEQSVQYNRELNNTLELSIALYGLGRANKNIGNLDLGEQQLRESAELSKSIADWQGVAYALKELAPLEYKQGHHKIAIKHLEEAVELFAQSKNQSMLLDTHSTLSHLHLEMGDLTLAKLHWEVANSHLDPQAMQAQKFSLSEHMAEILAAEGRHQEAYAMLQNSWKHRRTWQSEQSTQQLHELRAQYEWMAQEQEKLSLQRDLEVQKFFLEQETTRNRWLLGSIFSAAVIISVMLFLLWRLHKQSQRLYQLANFDSLTGLRNRRNCLNAVRSVYRLNQTTAHHLMMIDIDHFKRINDQYGHQVGDEVLRSFGLLCQQHFTHNQVIGRLGGEEFLVVLNASDHQTANDQATTFLQLIPSINDSLSQQVNQITASIGLAPCREGSSMKADVKVADMALYQAKNLGRNQLYYLDKLN